MRNNRGIPSGGLDGVRAKFGSLNARSSQRSKLSGHRENVPLAGRQRGKISNQPRSCHTPNPLTEQNLGQAEDLRRLPAASGTKPRATR